MIRVNFVLYVNIVKQAGLDRQYKS